MLFKIKPRCKTIAAMKQWTRRLLRDFPLQKMAGERGVREHTWKPAERCQGCLRPWGGSVRRWQANYINSCFLALWEWNPWTYFSDRNLFSVFWGVYLIHSLLVRLLILPSSLPVANYMLYIHIYIYANTRMHTHTHTYIYRRTYTNICMSILQTHYV